MILLTCFICFLAGLFLGYICLRGFGWIPAVLFLLCGGVESQAVITVTNATGSAVWYRIYSAVNRPASDWWYWTGNSLTGYGYSQPSPGFDWPYGVFWYTSNPSGLGANQTSPGAYAELDELTADGQVATWTGGGSAPMTNYVSSQAGCWTNNTSRWAGPTWAFAAANGDLYYPIGATEGRAVAPGGYFCWTNGQFTFEVPNGVTLSSFVVWDERDENPPSLQTFGVNAYQSSTGPGGGGGGTVNAGSVMGNTNVIHVGPPTGGTNGATTRDIYRLGDVLTLGQADIVSAIRGLGTNLSGIGSNGSLGGDYTNFFQRLITNTGSIYTQALDHASNPMFTNASWWNHWLGSNLIGHSNSTMTLSQQLSNDVSSAGGGFREGVSNASVLAAGGGPDTFWRLPYRPIGGAQSYVNINPLMDADFDLDNGTTITRRVSWLFVWVRGGIKWIVSVMAMLYVIASVRSHANVVVQQDTGGAASSGTEVGFAAWIVGTGAAGLILVSLPVLLIGAVDATFLWLGFSAGPFGEAAISAAGDGGTALRAVIQMADAVLPITFLLLLSVYLTVFDLGLFGHLMWTAGIHKFLGN